MLQKKLLTYEYYIKKLSMFMRNSYGIEEMTKLYVDVLANLDITIDRLFSMFSSVSNGNMQIIQAFSSDESDILDKVAMMFGISRHLSVIVDGEEHQLALNNIELQSFIKAKIFQNNYDGTKKASDEYYSMLSAMTDNRIRIVLVNDNTESARCLVYLNQNSDLSQNDRYLFLSGELTLKSMGIEYVHIITEIDNLAIFDGPARLGWNGGIWS